MFVGLGPGTNFTSPQVPSSGIKSEDWNSQRCRYREGRGQEAFQSLYIKSADGAGTQTALSNGGFATDWSRDGAILLSRFTDTRGGLYVLRIKDGNLEGGAAPYIAGPAIEGVFSGDGQWVAYSSAESGKGEIYVSSFPDATRKRTVISTGGGSMPRWSRDGRELYCIASNNTVMAATVTTGASFEVGKPKSVFTVAGRIRGWDVTPDGRFLLNVDVEQASTTVGNAPAARPAIVVSNWQTSLQ